MFHNITHLFFDLGSTLIDESACTEYRTEQLLLQPSAPSRDMLEIKMEEIISQNGLPYKDAAKAFGLETIKWPKHLEKIYPEVPHLLQVLHRKYKLGIIANQSLGTEQRLKEFGIRDYFDIIISSAEEGISKPNPEIFNRALKAAGCDVKQACMIGDRLDNDIEPAGKLGMKTIWVQQGSFAGGNLELIDIVPNAMVRNIKDILEVLMCSESEQMEHIMKLNPEPFEMIKSGRKTIELRLYDEKRKLIEVGDTIKFINTDNENDVLYTKVVDIHLFDNFETLYQTLPLLKCGYTKTDVGNAKAAHMEKYYSKEKQKEYGVIGIEICLV